MNRTPVKTNIFLLIFIFSFAVFLAHTLFTKTAVFSDGRFYYAITRSLVKDKDIKFRNEFTALNVTPTTTHQDYVWNMYPPGAPLFWMPLFIITDGFIYLTKLLSTPWGWFTLDTLGYGIVFQTAVAMSSIFLGTLGLYLIYQLLNDFFSEKISLFTTIALFATTNLLFYTAVEPINSHAVSFFIAALFLFYFLKYKTDKYYFFVLGIIGGVAGIVRTQDLLILIIPTIYVLQNFKFKFKKLSASFLLLTSGVLIAFLPQIIFWQKIFNTLWYSPYLDVGFNLLKPRIIFVLFNTQNGLFTITPFIALAVAGTFLVNKKLISLRNIALPYFLLQLYLISSWGNYYQGGSYSIRMMISSYPFVVFGLAEIINILIKKISLQKTYTVIFLFILLNNILIIRYLLLY